MPLESNFSGAVYDPARAAAVLQVRMLRMLHMLAWHVI